AQELTERLWAVLAQPGPGREGRRLRAAALAAYDRDGRRWDEAAGPVVERLGAGDPVYLAPWMAALRPGRDRLAGPLQDAFRNRDRPDDARTAAGILADYAADQSELLAGLLLEADERQWAALWPKLPDHREQAVARLQRELQQEMPPEDQVQ